MEKAYSVNSAKREKTNPNLVVFLVAFFKLLTNFKSGSIRVSLDGSVKLPGRFFNFVNC
jgi:hypothetical protein